MSKINKKILLSLCEESTQDIDEKNLQYYWASQDYKFNNVFLANWFQTEFNEWVRFVSPIQEIEYYLNCDDYFEKDFLNDLSSSPIRLWFSGGADSYTILKILEKNSIRSDELYTFVHTIGKDDCYQVNIEQYEGLKYLHNNHSPYNINLDKINEDCLLECFSDPMYLLRKPSCFVGSLFNITSDAPQFDDNFINLTGCGKPIIVCKNNRVYGSIIDSSVCSRSYTKNAVMFWYDPRNIKRFYQDCLVLFENIKDEINPELNFQMFNLDNQKLNEVLKRDSINNISVGKLKEPFFNKRNQIFFNKLYEHQSAKIISKFHQASNLAMSILPDYNFFIGQKPPAKFGFFIDLETKKVYSQEDIL